MHQTVLTSSKQCALLSVYFYLKNAFQVFHTFYNRVNNNKKLPKQYIKYAWIYKVHMS